MSDAAEAGAADRLVFFSDAVVAFAIPIFFATKDAWSLWIAGPFLAGRISERRT